MRYTIVPLRVGTKEFRTQVSARKIRALLRKHRAVEVGRYRGEPDAVVLAPEVFEELVSDHDQLESLRDALPLLLAALRSGVAIPSDTLDRLGVELPADGWQDLNAFQAAFPLELTHGEDGAPLARASVGTARPFEEIAEELEFLED